jgi:glycosyltransferase involved in cell wall biosynthesis
MIASDFSFIIPVYNRPEEIRELLESFCDLDSPKTFEIVIIEDGSSLDSRLIVENFQAELNISYYFKENYWSWPFTKLWDEKSQWALFYNLRFGLYFT